MPYVIASPCIDVNDKACVEECPVDCIYEGNRKSYINPKECIDCGACEPVCPVEAITQDRRVPQRRRVDSSTTMRIFFTEALPGRDEPLGSRQAVHRRWASSAPTPSSSSTGRRGAMLDGHVLSTPTSTSRCWRKLGRRGSNGLDDFGPPGILDQLWDTDGSSRSRQALDDLFDEQGVDAALLFCEYSPKATGYPGFRGPAADRRAQPTAVPAGGQRQPPSALPDRRRGAPAAGPRCRGAQAPSGPRWLPV